jgi:hypothetical protein
MTEVELTSEEIYHLWLLTGTVFLVVSFSWLILMLHFMPSRPGQTGWDFFFYGLPYSIIGPTTVFMAYEIFYPKRARKSTMYHLKRFARYTLGGIGVIMSFNLVMAISIVTFSKTLGDNAIFPGMVAWVFTFLAIGFLWLRRQNSRIKW